MNIIKHKYGKRTVSLLLAVILVLCPLQVRAADNKPTIEIGDYIQMGTYGGEPIVWRCVAKDSNGPLMLSDRVLCDYMPYELNQIGIKIDMYRQEYRFTPAFAFIQAV